MRRGDCVSDGEDQPVRGGMQDQAHLVGERAAAAGTIGGELSLVQLDEVLGLAAGAINRLVNMLGRSGLETGDDEADIEPLLCGLDPGAGATVLVPRLGLITGLGETAQAGFMIECAAGADVVGGRLDGIVEDRIAGQTEDEIDAVFFAPRHHLRAAVMPVAADRNVGRGPMPADAADEPTQMAAHLLTGRRFARAQQYRYWS